jgi:hypothetical protein
VNQKQVRLDEPMRERREHRLGGETRSTVRREKAARYRRSSKVRTRKSFRRHEPRIKKSARIRCRLEPHCFSRRVTSVSRIVRVTLPSTQTSSDDGDELRPTGSSHDRSMVICSKEMRSAAEVARPSSRTKRKSNRSRVMAMVWKLGARAPSLAMRALFSGKGMQVS